MTSQVLSFSDWKDINPAIVNTYQMLIQKYFNQKWKLSGGFQTRSLLGLEIKMKDDSRGYVFCDPLQLDRDFEKQINTVQKAYQSQGKMIIRKFVDYENALAGFSWKDER